MKPLPVLARTPAAPSSGRPRRASGAVALASLLRPSAAAGRAPPRGVLGTLPLPQKAKRVIWLTMAGGPSHLETFDHKPKLAEMHGKPMPECFTKGQQLAQLQGQKLICFGPQHPFQKFGKNGTEICELFPHIGSVIDDICLIRSMTTEAINHDPAHMFMNTGSQIAGRPSMGAWVTYGLGSEAEDLPGFVVLTSLGKGGPEPADRRAAVEQRVPAQPVPGRAAAQQGRSGAVPRQPRRASRASSRATTSPPINALNRAARRARSTTPRSPPASPSTRWRSRCRPACPS